MLYSDDDDKACTMLVSIVGRGDGGRGAGSCDGSGRQVTTYNGLMTADTPVPRLSGDKARHWRAIYVTATCVHNYDAFPLNGQRQRLTAAIHLVHKSRQC